MQHPLLGMEEGLRRALAFDNVANSSAWRWLWLGGAGGQGPWEEAVGAKAARAVGGLGRGWRVPSGWSLRSAASLGSQGWQRSLLSEGTGAGATWSERSASPAGQVWTAAIAQDRGPGGQRRGGPKGTLEGRALGAVIRAAPQRQAQSQGRGSRYLQFT